jgi:hypothetical protein
VNWAYCVFVLGSLGDLGASGGVNGVRVRDVLESLMCSVWSVIVFSVCLS